MAVTDPNAIRFSNDRIRVAADKLAQMYNFIVQTANEFTALGMGTAFPNSAGEIVIDGSATDGRPIINGQDVNNIINLAATLRTTFEATSNQQLNRVLRVAVNTTPR